MFSHRGWEYNAVLTRRRHRNPTPGTEAGLERCTGYGNDVQATHLVCVNQEELIKPSPSFVTGSSPPMSPFLAKGGWRSKGRSPSRETKPMARTPRKGHPVRVSRLDAVPSPGELERARRSGGRPPSCHGVRLSPSEKMWRGDPGRVAIIDDAVLDLRRGVRGTARRLSDGTA